MGELATRNLQLATPMAAPKTVAQYIAENEQWQEVIIALQDIIHRTDMVETIKWGMPTYTIDKKNVIGLAAFKKHVALWFHQGVFLADTHKKLVNAQEGTTKAMRHWRFTKLEEVAADEAIIYAYLEEAAQNQREGKEILPKRTPPKKKPLIIPPELQAVLDKNPELRERFDALKLTQKRNNCNFIVQAKRAETKQKRIERLIPLILAGKGIYE